MGARARGNHICSLGSTSREFIDIAAPFLKAGLALGEKCVFLSHDHEPLDMERALAKRRVPLRSARRRGVELATCTEAGLAVLPFSPERTIDRWAKAAETATREGFTGLRVVVEMTWALYGGLERLAEYEAKAGRLFVERPISALCHYDRLRFSETVLRDAVLAHPELGVHGEITANPDYLPCDAFLRRLRIADEVSGAGARSDRRRRTTRPGASPRRP